MLFSKKKKLSFSKQKPKILMVEDNRANHQLFQMAFEQAGFEVKIEQNAEVGFVDIAAEFAPDIISLDIMIGKSGADLQVGGLEALQLLKTDERTAHIPVMMLTNFFEETKVAKAKEYGAVDFLSLQSGPINRTTDYFLRYLQNPKGYVPVNKVFIQE